MSTSNVISVCVWGGGGEGGGMETGPGEHNQMKF